MTAGAPLGEVRFTLPPRRGQKAREVCHASIPQQVWAKRVELSDGKRGRVAATCLVVRLVTRLGGFLARKGDGEPGAKTLRQGLQRVVDFAAGLRYARDVHAL